MQRFVWMLGVASLVGCAVEPGSERESETSQDSLAYHPMGFARVTAGGGLVAQFTSTGGAVTVSHGATGVYGVTFPGLGDPVSGGNVQIAAEGTGTARCRVSSWGGSPNLTASVRCTSPTGTLTDTPFAALFHRYTMPAPNSWPINAAYAYVTSSGSISSTWDYNSSGTHNTATKTGAGAYTVNLAGATVPQNASMMVTSYGGIDPGALCSISSWGGNHVYVSCVSSTGAAVDSAFSFSYATSGPTLDQQGGHAWFDGATTPAGYRAALGKVSWCSPASVTGSRAGALATVTVSGDLGPWDGDVFRRASFVTNYGSAGYCKVESLSATGAAPASNGITTVRCYTPAGAPIAVPRFTLTHVTSDATGPC
jgi:hypothetical protein